MAEPDPIATPMRTHMPGFTRRSRRAGWLLLAATAVLGACGDEGRRPTDDVEGTWVIAADTVDAVYLRITPDSIHEYAEDGEAGCFDLRAWEIVDVDGDRFRLESGDREITVLLRRDDSDLIVDAFDQIERYEASTIDPTALPLCEPSNPGADCAALPLLGMGSALDGEIEATDDANPDGSRYDLYRVSELAPLAVKIEMTSTVVDSYLVLYDSAGAFIEDNDDASNLTLDARLTPSLEAACYIVMATTAFPDELGAYTISMTEPES